MFKLTVLLTFVCVFCANGVESDEEGIVSQISVESLIVQISDGKVVPKILTSRAGYTYFAYLGIPYAQPPVVNLRYDVPYKPKPWNMRQATEYGPKCIQYHPFEKKVEGSEDCLYLNVFTKNIPEDNRTLLPVMVFFQPGAFNFDSCDGFGAKYFMDEDVVLVTFNYRLGSFGFLNTGDHEIQGNAGMKDQVMVLKWIQNEIGRFGGDKNRVTLFGDRGGGASVHYHMMSAMSKGLFNYAISMSGNALCPYSFDRNPRRSAKKLGMLLNCPTSNTYDLAQCLRGLEARIIAEKQAEMYEWGTDPIAPFAPSVESVMNLDSIFLLDTPYRLIQAKKMVQMPWIVGVDNKYGLLNAQSILQNSEQTTELNQEWQNYAPHAFYFRDTAMEPDAISTQIKAFYFGGNDISSNTLANLTNLYSDRFCFHCSRVGALLQARENEAVPVYLYQMGFVSNHSYLDFIKAPHDGVSEGDYLQYLFNMEDTFPEIVEGDALDFSKNLVKLWVSFATHGKPNETWGGEHIWKPISSEEVKGNKMLQYYKLDKDTSVVGEEYFDRMQFWDSLPLNEYEDEVISPYSRRILFEENFDDVKI